MSQTMQLSLSYFYAAQEQLYMYALPNVTVTGGWTQNLSCVKLNVNRSVCNKIKKYIRLSLKSIINCIMRLRDVATYKFVLHI